MPEDRRFMDAALHEASLALAEGNLPVGAVIVRRGEIVARGHNKVDSGSSDLYHAEIEAIAGIQHELLKGKGEFELYSTLEPCLMCFGTICHFRFKRVVFGARDEIGGYRACAGLSRFYAGRGIQFVEGMAAKESIALFKSYVEKTGLRAHILEWLS